MGGSIRSAADVVKAIALGADALLYRHGGAAGPGLSPVPDLPERQMQLGHRHPTGRELVARLDPEEGRQRLVNLLTAWRHEIMEMMGGHGHQLH